MNTVLDLGKIDYQRSGRKECQVTIEVKLEKGNLSMVGNIWNPRHTDVETCGQCYDTIAQYFPRNKKVKRLIELWKRWHLNDMRAGTPVQEEYLRSHPIPSTNYYEEACKALAKVGLNPDKGYSYGSQWLKEELPSEVVDEILSLISQEVA